MCMTTSSGKLQDHLAPNAKQQVFFFRYNIPIPRFEFFLAFFLASLPFQMSLWQLFINLSQKLYPPTNPFPWCYIRIILVFTTDFLFVAALLAMLFFNRIPWRRCFWHGPAKYLLFLTIISLLSLFFSKAPSFPLQYVKLFQHSMPLLLFCLIPYCFKATSFRPFLRGVFIALFTVGIIQSIIAIIQYFTQNSIGLSFLGEESWSSAFESTRGELSIFPSKMVYPFIKRAAGTAMHSNTLGSILFFTIMVSYGLYLEFRNKKACSLVLIGIYLQITALFLSFSRSGLTAAFIGTVVWLWGTRRQLKQSSSDEGPKKVLMPLVLTVVISIISCIAIFHPAFTERGFINENDTVQGSNKERFVNFRVSLGMIADKPLLGVGFDSYQIVKSLYNPTPEPLDKLAPVHNSYLLIAAETGLLGLAAYLFFILSVLIRALKAPFNGLHASLFISFLGFLYLNCLDYGFYLMNNLTYFFFAVAALLVTHSMLSKKENAY